MSIEHGMPRQAWHGDGEASFLLDSSTARLVLAVLPSCRRSSEYCSSSALAMGSRRGEIGVSEFVFGTLCLLALVGIALAITWAEKRDKGKE